MYYMNNLNIECLTNTAYKITVNGELSGNLEKFFGGGFALERFLQHSS